jgi:hypothetical protein
MVLHRKDIRVPPRSHAAPSLLRDCSETTPYHLLTNSVPPPIARIGGGMGVFTLI